MKQRWISSTALACSLLILAACGGGSTGTSVPSVPSGSSPNSGLTATATFVVSVPHKSTSSGLRTPKYITPAVQGIDFSVSAQGSAPGAATPAPPLGRGYVFYALTPQATYCTNGPSALTCTLQVQAYPGADLITVNTYDGTNPSLAGTNGGPNHIVSTGFITATILPGVANTISIATQGVVSNVEIALDTPYPPLGTALTQNVHVTASDAQSAIIIGNFDMPLALADSDTSGATTLSTGSLTSSATVATLAYTGVTMLSPATLTVQTTSVASNQNACCSNGFKATTTFQGGGSGIVSSPSSLSFAHTGSLAQTVTISGPGTTAPYAVNPSISDTKGDPNCNGIVSVSGSSPTFTVTPIKAGSCWLTVTSGSSINGNVPVTVSP